MRGFIAIGLAMVACGGSKEAGPIECSKDDRTGTYLIEYEERDGTCGEIADTVSRLDEPAMIPGVACEVTSERWSEGDCKLERSIECTSEGDDQLLTGTGVTEQTTDDGSKIEGVFTLLVQSLSTGETICTSTYDQTATRQ